MSDHQAPKHPIYLALSELSQSLCVLDDMEASVLRLRGEVSEQKKKLTEVLNSLSEDEVNRLTGRDIELMDHSIRIDEENLSITVTHLTPSISMFDLTKGIPSNDEQQEF